MARKDSAKAGSHRGFNDIAGFVALGVGLLLLLAQVSYDPYDVAKNKVPPNATAHNWIGPVGAYIAYYLFLTFGAAAFAIPIFCFGYGLSHLVEVLGYLRRRKTWALILFVSLVGFFDLHSSWFKGLGRNIHAPTGGVVGQHLNDWVFRKFGIPGATI